MTPRDEALSAAGSQGPSREVVAAIRTCFGANLKRARKAAGLSQEALAIRASLHRTEVALLERGERLPRIDTAIRLAGSLGVPLGQLLEGIEWVPGTLGPGGFSASDPSSKR